MAAPTKFISLTQGKKTRVCAADFDRLRKFKWTAMFNPGPNGGRWYAYRKVNGKNIYLHHSILPRRVGFDVDHRSTDGLDNTRRNLRYLTRSGNNANRRKTPGLSSRFKGVTWDKTLGFWRAQVKSQGKHFTLGLFRKERDAGLAYDRAATRLFGEAARLNFL